MKPTSTQSVHHVGVAEEEIEMSIDQASIVHIMTLLTDLYSDPMMAVIREYSTNAYDSNVEAGNPAPIVVTLPTTANPNFSVQDNGIGLSVDDIKKVYSLYGASTKRESNLVNGMLGLGCKSGLTYALQFTITAVKNGVKAVAVSTKGEKGVGVIKFLDTKATTEGNGVTITIPVQTNHIHSFNEKASEFYRYWPKGTVLVNGEEPDRSFLDDAVWLCDDVAVLKEGYGSKVIMGNVAYPWPTERRDPFQHSIIVRVPIGTLDFPPSREAIQWTALSKDTTNTAMRYVLDRFPHALRERVLKAPTPFAQAKILNEWRYVSNNITKGALRDFRGTYQVTHERDRIVWRWSRMDNSAAKSNANWQNIDNEDAVMIVTEFPFKAISQSHRRRFESLSAWYGEGTPNPKSSVPRVCLILPVGAQIGVLEGRRNVLTWDDVVALTPEPPKEVRAKGTARVFKYTVVQNHKSFEKDVLDPKDGPIVWRRRMDPRSWNNQDHMASLFPEAQMVKLYERQIEKFCKLHPSAVNLKDHFEAECKKAKKALTKDDKDCVGLDNNHSIWQRLSDAGILAKIKDPDIQRIQKLRGHAKASKTLQRARLLGVAPTDASTDYAKVLAKYPLLSAINYPQRQHAGDLIFYINSKWESLQSGKQ